MLAVPLDVQVPATPEVDALDQEFRRERLEDVVSEFLARVFAEAPTLLEIEDVHWMDEASASLLRRISQDVAEGPWVIVVTRRDQESGFVARDLADATVLKPAPLAGAEAESMLLAATESDPMLPDEVATLIDRSGGNPLFLLELLGAARAAGSVEGLPTSVEGIVTAQIDRLPAADLRLLRFASVLGMSVTDDLMQAVLEGEQATLDPAAWQRLGEFVEEVEPGVHRFRHGLMRDAAYEGLPFRRRRDLHARVGETICRRAGADDEDFAEVLSLHFFHAQRFEEAWRFSRVAALRAASIYANVEAREFFLRALDAGRRLSGGRPREMSSTAESLGDVRTRLGENDDALLAYREARGYLEGDRVGQAWLLLKEARVYDVEGRFPQALRALTRGGHLIDGEKDERVGGLRALITAEYGGVRWSQGRNVDAIKLCRSAFELGEKAGELAAMAHASNSLGLAEWSLGLPGYGRYYRQALELYQRLGDLAKQAVQMSNLGANAYFEGRWDESREWYERARDVCVTTGNVNSAAIDTANLGELLLQQGRPAEAEEHLRPSLRVFRASGGRESVVFASTLLAVAAARSGRFDDAASLFDEVQALSRELGSGDRSADVAGFSAEFLVLQQRSDEAIAMTDNVLESLPGTDPYVPLLLRIRRVRPCPVFFVGCRRGGVSSKPESGARAEGRPRGRLHPGSAPSVRSHRRPLGDRTRGRPGRPLRKAGYRSRPERAPAHPIVNAGCTRRAR